MTTLGKLTVGLFWFLFLTLLTQVGGLIWLFSRALTRSALKGRRQKLLQAVIFGILYLVFNALLIPRLAQFAGRVPLPVFSNDNLKPENLMFALMNRHYVRPELYEALTGIAAQMQHEFPGSVVWYMDANFPFIDGYPLEPHFSHSDGKKVDIAFYWEETGTNQEYPGTPSPFGYGVCAEPLPGEYDYAEACERRGYWYISLDKTLAEPFFDKTKYSFQAAKTRALALFMAEQPAIGKILIQTHLEKRLQLERYDKFRQQGCKAARHDDHFHIQLK